MGIFGARTTVALRLAEPHVVAGGVVRGALELGEPDRRTRQTRLEVLYRNTYREDTTTADGEASTTRRREDVLVVQQLLEQPRPGVLDLAVPLPADAPGSAAGSVEWRVRAVVDRARAGDAVDEQPLTVLAPAAPLAAWAEQPLEADPVLGADVHVATRLVRPGDAVTGQAVLRPVEDLEGRSLRVRLRRVRYDPDDNRDEDVVAETVLAEDVRLRAGRPATSSFSLQVPAEAPPSFVAAHNAQRWYVELALDRRLLPDRTAQLELVVHTA